MTSLRRPGAPGFAFLRSPSFRRFCGEETPTVLSVLSNKRHVRRKGVGKRCARAVVGLGHDGGGGGHWMRFTRKS